MKKLLIILLLFSCSKIEYKPCIEGVYKIDGIDLIFENGIIDGFSDCNNLYGSYILENDSISMRLGGTKVYCKGEENRIHLNNKFKYQLTNEELILYGSDYTLIFSKIH